MRDIDHGGFRVFGDRVVIRKIIGQPQFSIVILTISLGFVFRSGAGMIWGQSPRTMDTPLPAILSWARWSSVMNALQS